MTPLDLHLASVLGSLTAMFVDGPARDATMPLELESTGFPPVHLTLPGSEAGIEHVYVADARDPGPLIRYRYRGPITSR
jgi:hypothetical protein